MNPFPIPSLQILRDLPLRVSVSDRLREEIDRVLSSAPREPDPSSSSRRFFEDAMMATDNAIVFLDEEANRLTQEKFSATDPNALRQRWLGEPRRLIDQTINVIKQKISNEKQEWSRRLNKQSREVQRTFDLEIGSLQTDTVQVEHGQVRRPSEAWIERYEAWLTDTFAKWSQHQAELLRTKTSKLVRAELDTIEGLVDAKLEPDWPAPESVAFKPRVTLAEVEAPFEPPSTLAAIFDTFKNGLNTVAMLAGLVIIPVIGSMMQESPLTMRAFVMGGLVLPIAGFAIWGGFRARRRLVAVQGVKADELVAKAVAADFRTQLDGFRAEIEAFCARYGQESLKQILSVIEPAVSHQLSKREKLLASELASTQLKLDQINEQMMAVRQIKNGLINQLAVDLKRQIAAH